MRKFKITLTCPLPRIGFSKSEKHCLDEIKQMEDYLKIADGDIVVFPEGYIKTSDVSKVEILANKYHKWIITGSEDDGEAKSLYVLVIDPDKGQIFKHCKSALTDGDRNNKAKLGKDIKAVDTPLVRIGTVLCYELHFPEVSRIFCLDGAMVLINTIGTGMYHKQQFDEWTSLAKARAIENRCFVLGNTHYCDSIPMMFAYDPHGRLLDLKSDNEGIMEVDIDLDLIDERQYFNDRNPKAYKKISEGDYYYE